MKHKQEQLSSLEVPDAKHSGLHLSIVLAATLIKAESRESAVTLVIK